MCTIYANFAQLTITQARKYKTQLMPYLSNDMQVDSSLAQTSESGTLPEVDIYLSLLVLLRLIDKPNLSSVSIGTDFGRISLTDCTGPRVGNNNTQQHPGTQ